MNKNKKALQTLIYQGFSRLFAWQGQKDLNPRHAVLERDNNNAISSVAGLFDLHMTCILIILQKIVHLLQISLFMKSVKVRVY